MIYGARLRQAREMALITQADLARETQIPQATLSRAERDEYDLGVDRLALIAAHLEFPEAFFTSALATDFAQRPIHFRAQAGMSMKQANQATRVGEVVAEAVVRLEREFEGPELLVRATPGDPVQAAAAVRDVLGVRPDEPVVGLPVLLEQAGVSVIGLPLPAHRRDAFSLWMDEKPIIALLDTDAGDRQLWSTAHEVGHLVMHHGMAASKTIEPVADEFAMHFLTPLVALEREMPEHPTMSDFAMLKRRWGVSIAALIRLARRLDRITADQYSSLFRQMSARGERLRERTFIPPTKPRGLRAMAELAYGLSPAKGLASDNNWTTLFAEQVLDRHARSNELPLRRTLGSPDRNNVIAMGSHRRSPQASRLKR